MDERSIEGLLQARVEQIEFGDGSHNAAGVDIVCSFNAVSEPRLTLGACSIREVWDSPMEALERALLLLGLEPRRRYTFGPSFVRSLRHAGISTNDGLLETVYRKAAILVSDSGFISSGVDAHPIEERPHGGQKTRAADGAKAWRSDVTQHGAGYRLHFWLLPDGLIEFANVADHESLFIAGG